VAVTNTLGYYKMVLITLEQSLKGQALGANPIKLPFQVLHTSAGSWTYPQTLD